MDEETLDLIRQCSEILDKQPLPEGVRYAWIDGEWRKITTNG